VYHSAREERANGNKEGGEVSSPPATKADRPILYALRLEASIGLPALIMPDLYLLSDANYIIGDSSGRIGLKLKTD